ncbi:NupC/NupG family nucleoside CNT transporter [Pseudoxanthomonas putridarboris]|uniref:Nucleoside transporter C-terminal domain-containing protein n=1 Tax=Pseudoxanthomonas putridarboris TaxID=752605 RepID=A0ABU9IYQ1_9GAMM
MGPTYRGKEEDTYAGRVGNCQSETFHIYSGHTIGHPRTRSKPSMGNWELIRACIGLLAFVGFAWLLSERKRGFPYRPILVGLLCQVVLGLILTRIPAITQALGVLAHAVDAVQASAVDGAAFVFGYLAGGAQPFEISHPHGDRIFIFAFQALPALLLVSALAALLWHWNVLRILVRVSGRVFGRLFGVSGPVGVSTSACIFLGMVEAPMLVRPLVPQMSRGDLFILMVHGMSVIAGSMMIVLASVLASRMPDAFSHLLIASLISTPLAIGMARAIVPSDPAMAAQPLELHNEYKSSLDALTSGTLKAVRMVVNIAALLIVFVGMVALVDRFLGWLPHTGAPLTLATLFGWLFSPIAWLMGIPLPDLQEAGTLLGTKIAFNEVVAYVQLAGMPQGAMTDKSTLMMTYALCSFGNIGSVAILIGTLTSLAPEKAGVVVRLGFKALAAAFLTSCTTATVIGILHSLI